MRKVKAALARVKAKHGIDHHPLTFADFESICESEEIRLQLIDIRLSGYFYRLIGRPYITLDVKLEPQRLLFVAFHELAHYLMHKPDKVLPEPGTGKTLKEKEADLFAELATT